MKKTKILLQVVLILLFAINLFASDIFKATGSGAMSETYTKTPAGPMLHEVRLHLNAAATTDNFIVSLYSVDGTAWDVNFLTKDMTGHQDAVYAPEKGRRMLKNGDKITFTFLNSDSRTWGLEIQLEK